MQLYGNLARLFEDLVRYIGKMNRLAGELISTSPEIDFGVREDLRNQKKRYVVRVYESRKSRIVLVKS